MEREKVEHQLRTQYCDCCRGQQGLHSAGASEEHRMSSACPTQSRASGAFTYQLACWLRADCSVNCIAFGDPTYKWVQGMPVALEEVLREKWRDSWWTRTVRWYPCA